MVYSASLRLCVSFNFAVSLLGQQRHRVDSLERVADLEVAVRTGGVTGAADLRDHLPGADPLTLLDEVRGIVSVTRGPAAPVIDDDHLAVTRDLIAAVADRAVGGGADRGPLRRGNVDPAMLLVGFVHITARNSAFDGPLERGAAIRGSARAAAALRCGSCPLGTRPARRRVRSRRPARLRVG